MKLPEKIMDFLKGRKKEEGMGAAGEMYQEQEEIPTGKKRNILRLYQDILDQAGFKIKAFPWIVIGIAAAASGAVGSSILITLFLPKISMFFSLIVFLVILDLVLGYPYIIALRKIDAIEEALPDALKQMADVLKAGGTYEFALREVATSEYGPLTKEIELVLRKIEEGQSLENSLRDFSDNINSRLIKRSVTVIIDAVKAGAGLAEVLDDIADDIRAMHRIERERVAETQLQVLFMVAAGAIVAPTILGLVSSVIDLFISAATSLNVSEKSVAEAVSAKNAILLLIQAYIFIEVVSASVMIAIMRHGKIGKSMVYIPVLLLIAYAIYYASNLMSGLLLGGLQ